MQEILANRKVPIHYYPEDLEKDVRTLKKVLK
jgi:predicted HTH domain antitoxin